MQMSCRLWDRRWIPESFLCPDNGMSEHIWCGITIRGATLRRIKLVFSSAEVSRADPNVAGRAGPREGQAGGDPYPCRRAPRPSTACCSRSKRSWRWPPPPAGARPSTGRWARSPHRCRCPAGPAASPGGAGAGGCTALGGEHRDMDAVRWQRQQEHTHGAVTAATGRATAATTRRVAVVTDTTLESVTVNSQNKRQPRGGRCWGARGPRGCPAKHRPRVPSRQQCHRPAPVPSPRTKQLMLAGSTCSHCYTSGTKTLKNVISECHGPLRIPMLLDSDYFFTQAGWEYSLHMKLKFPGSARLIMQFTIVGSILAWPDPNFSSLQQLHLCQAWLKGAKGVKTTGRSTETHTHITYLPCQETNSALQ